MEWTDTNIRNDTFEGTAREILRVGYDRNHPMDDTIFDPLAKARQPRLRQISTSAWETRRAGRNAGPGRTPFRNSSTRCSEKFCGSLPDINLRPKDMLSPNGRYRIPSTGS